ncbi:hypothetical protein KP509_25G038400 [Ceratopteris richardii]|uniref:Reverse transcriptase domain-containing protein n=1 Tax=Ceratopteris richardii TaxID=49495 RepID=A0A8T2RS09_CERRI|nr:hypothetical protein KP509_25G038400 [Ceratopteris richardii]
MALHSLKNEKAPRLDGLTKEFVMRFWPSLKTLIMDVCNEIWRDQKMPYSFKQGKMKLIPKLDMMMEHAFTSYHEVVGMQIYFEKAFDEIQWNFIAVVLKKLGFALKFCHLIYVLAKDSASHVEINRRLSPPFLIECFPRYQCFIC